MYTEDATTNTGDGSNTYDRPVETVFLIQNVKYKRRKRYRGDNLLFIVSTMFAPKRAVVFDLAISILVLLICSYKAET
ncbi:unnamed protein product [Cyberlindnera jadinii]|uniref:Uncharacterized protein n=1 Tax=Cyberlindnera jadinii (strain ATCC 18201 / CBS 1600 / BCRC 20928 / JCM 3617 / NBRC 0987 / NRRL Y-1542) TaxID=983966 RepID=A0A0H5C5H3_CYBJN|nr:unnamed protein product [Cyberlindnera jadinii]